jgi:hypothetical protein
MTDIDLAAIRARAAREERWGSGSLAGDLRALCDEVDRLRAELADVRHTLDNVNSAYADAARAERDAARYAQEEATRLAESLQT